MDENFSNIWEIYGIGSDPFFVGPILVYGGDIPISTFTGRKKETNRLSKMIKSFGGSRIIVSGEPGVGKTSFSNVVRAKARESGFFTPIKEIAVQPDWNVNEFILNTLFSIFNTLRREKKQHVLSNELYKELESLITNLDLIGFSGSISILGTGIGGGKNTSRTNSQITIAYLIDLFEQIVKELRKGGYKELIIHYNNLENFQQNQLQLLFRRIRDFLLIPHVHFIFVGDLTVPPALQSIPQVSSIFNDSPIILGNLSFEEVLKILSKRIEALAIDDLDFVIPYEDNAVKKIYDLYSGNIRNILNSLSTAIREISEERPIVLNEKLLCSILSLVAEERWLTKLTDWEKQILVCILKEGEITNKEISKTLNKLPQNISKVTNKLLGLSAIYIHKVDGTSKYFSVHPSVKWFLLSDKKEKRMTGGLLDYMN